MIEISANDIIEFDYHGRKKRVAVSECGINNASKRMFIRGRNLHAQQNKLYGTYFIDQIKEMQTVAKADNTFTAS